MVNATDEIGVSASGERQLRRHWFGDTSPWATVLIVHGGGEHSARYDHVAGQMVGAGLDVHSFDWVGHGGSGGSRWHIDLYETYYDDLAERIAYTRHPDLPLVLYGHSMGGLISLGYCLTEAIFLTCWSSLPHLETAAPPRTQGGRAATGEDRTSVSARRWLERGATRPRPRRGRDLLRRSAGRDEDHRRLGCGKLREQARVRAGLSQLTVPVFVAHGGNDTIAHPHASAPIGELPNAERRFYPSLQHETHNEPEGAEVVAAVIEWLRQRIRPRPPPSRSRGGSVR